MLIGYLFDNNYWDLKKILYFYFCPQMLPSVRTFYCPNISGQKYLPWLSGPETKNLSFLLSFLYSLIDTLFGNYSMACFIYILDSSNSSSTTFWTDQFGSSSRSNWTVIWTGSWTGNWTDNNHIILVQQKRWV